MITLPQSASFNPWDQYRLPDPYPEIRVLGQNSYYAQLLLDDYAGKVSETTAIMQYVYHHMEMEQNPAWQEVADLEHGISVIEMNHLEMLGETILLLGAAPRYCDSQQQPWTPHFVVDTPIAIDSPHARTCAEAIPFYRKPGIINSVSGEEDKIDVVFPVIADAKWEWVALSTFIYNLPARRLVNQAFTFLAMNAGMDSGILDPTNQDLLGMIYATEALLGRDECCIEYIGAFHCGKTRRSFGIT